MECELLAGVLRRSHHNIDVAGMELDLRSAKEEIAKAKPDVVLISAQLQDGKMAGFKLLRHLVTADSRARGVMLLDWDQADLVVEAFRKGARGVFTRSESPKDLPGCVAQVHKGQIWADTDRVQLIIESLAQAPSSPSPDIDKLRMLQKREQDVAKLVAEGLTNREISRRLDLSEHTVKNYLFRVFEKLGVSSRAELIIKVLKQQYGSPPPGPEG